MSNLRLILVLVCLTSYSLALFTLPHHLTPGVKPNPYQVKKEPLIRRSRNLGAVSLLSNLQQAQLPHQQVVYDYLAYAIKGEADKLVNLFAKSNKTYVSQWITLREESGALIYPFSYTVTGWAEVAAAYQAFIGSKEVLCLTYASLASTKQDWSLYAEQDNYLTNLRFRYAILTNQNVTTFSDGLNSYKMRTNKNGVTKIRAVRTIEDNILASPEHNAYIRAGVSDVDKCQRVREVLEEFGDFWFPHHHQRHGQEF